MRVSEMRERLAAREAGQSSSHGSHSEVEDQEKTGKQEAWWVDLLVFLIVGLGTLWLYSEVNAYEAGEGTLHSKIEFVYGIIGKWGVVGLPACIALIKLCTGLAKLSRSR